jgi:hypothetical protein
MFQISCLFSVTEVFYHNIVTQLKSSKNCLHFFLGAGTEKCSVVSFSIQDLLWPKLNLVFLLSAYLLQKNFSSFEGKTSARALA